MPSHLSFKKLTDNINKESLCYTWKQQSELLMLSQLSPNMSFYWMIGPVQMNFENYYAKMHVFCFLVVRTAQSKWILKPVFHHMKIFQRSQLGNNILQKCSLFLTSFPLYSYSDCLRSICFHPSFYNLINTIALINHRFFKEVHVFAFT